MRALAAGKPIRVRSPGATRPATRTEPLGSYLLLAKLAMTSAEQPIR